MNIQEVYNTIEQLENDVTTFENCFKLASLYTVRDNYERQESKLNEVVEQTEEPIVEQDDVEQEYSDILPQYREYIEIKKQYQLGNLSEKALETQIKKVCQEIREFIQTMYSCTDMPIEREHIKNMIGGLQNL